MKQTDQSMTASQVCSNVGPMASRRRCGASSIRRYPVLVDLADVLTSPGLFGRDQVSLRAKSAGLDIARTVPGRCTPGRAASTARCWA